MKPLVHEAGISSASVWHRPGRTDQDDVGFASADRIMLQIEMEQRANETRSTLFDGLKVRNPLWDMLLALLAAQRASSSLSMSDLCAMCDAPESTALRLIHQLRDKGYVEMTPDRSDRRRTRVRLTAKAEAQFERYFQLVDHL